MTHTLMISPDDMQLAVWLINLKTTEESKYFWLDKIAERLTTLIDEETTTWRDIIAVNIVMLQVLSWRSKISFITDVVSTTILEFVKELFEKKQ